MQKARSQRAPKPRLLPLVGTRFQVLFHSPPGVLFTFPSRYWCTIGHGRVFSLGGWSPQIPTGFLVSRRTQVPKSLVWCTFRIRGSHPLWWAVPGRFRYTLHDRAGQCPTPALQPRHPKATVWALPVSLAATQGISFDFFSWGYLDVSVLPVGSSLPMDSAGVTRHDSRRVSPFGHPRINAYVRLPEAFRSLSRPSSPVRAKASTVRPYFA